MSNKTMGKLYGVAAICFAVSCVNYFINGNILKGALWLGLTAACGFLGYLRLKPQNNDDSANSESIGNSDDPANSESSSNSEDPANSESSGNSEDLANSENSGNSEDPASAEGTSSSEGSAAAEDESNGIKEANF